MTYELAPPGTRRPPRSRVRAVAAWAPALALLLYLALAVRAGLPAAAAARGVLVVLLTQLLPGVLVWRCVRPVRGWWVEDLALGFAIGSGVAVAAQAVAGTVDAAWPAAVAGPLLALGLLAAPRTRRALAQARTEALPVWWGPLVAGVSLLHLVPTQSFYRTNPLPSSGFTATYVDLPFHQALMAELATRGPKEIPSVLGEPLHYHWFSHAWMAQVGVVGDVELELVLMRLLPALVAVVAVQAVAAAAVRLLDRAWAGPVAGLLALVAADLNVFGGPHRAVLVTHLSPSLSLSVPLVTGLFVVLAVRWRGQGRAGAIWVLLLLALLAVGMKASALPVVVAGAALAAAAALVLRTAEARRVLADAVLLLAVLLVGAAVLFRGATAGTVPDPAGAAGSVAQLLGITRGYVAARPVLVLAFAGAALVMLLARGAGVWVALCAHRDRRDPALWLLAGTGVAGAVAVVLLAHPGLSQYYFLRNALPALAIGSAAGLVVVVERLGRLRWAVLAAGAVTGTVAAWLPAALLGPVLDVEDDGAAVRRVLLSLALFAVALGLGALVTGILLRARDARSAVPATALVALLAAVVLPALPALGPRELLDSPAPAGPTSANAFSADQVEAARWLRERSDRRDVVATNRHCSTPEPAVCDSRRFVVAAYTERRVLVEGWAYTRTWAESPDVVEGPATKPFWNPELLRLNDELFRDPTPERAAALRDLGVRWLFVDRTVPSGDLGTVARLAHETTWAQVYELTR
ncbi:MAG TPA: hypothetical protein VM433_04040 [Mycobacteriales bacterium]|nr:hypothetical protein [Mycobacteriales bacterium]